MTELGGDAYRLVFEASGRPMLVFDRQTLQLLLVNEAACRLYGWSRDELLQMTLYDIRPPSEHKAFEASFAAAKATSTYPRAGRHWKKSGEIFEVALEITRLELDARPVSLIVVTDITGVADAERRFRLLVENSADGIALTAEDHKIQYVSPTGERILGYGSNEIVGVSWSELRHPDDRAITTLPAPGETRLHTVRLRGGDGKYRWIESSITNLSHDPAVRAFVSNFRDITLRMHSEQAASESQRRLEYLLSATSAITYTVRMPERTGATFISNNVRDLLGYTPEEFMSEPEFWIRRVHDDDRARTVAELDRLLVHGQATSDYRFRHADGTYRWMRDAARLVRDKHGQPVEMVGYWIDITEQVRAVDAIKRSEASFRALIERLPSAVFVHRDGVYVYANSAAAALAGYDSPNGIVGRPVLDSIPPDEHEIVRHRMTQTVERGTAPPREARLVRRDGSLAVWEVEAVLLDFDGKPCVVAIGRDISERRELFERMALADRMLTVGTLAAGVAHEINNPLAFVAGNLELLASELPNLLANVPSRLARADVPALVGDARDGVARVSGIVRELRALSRAEDETLGPVDVTAVLASSIKMANNEIRHRARVRQSYEHALPLVRAHASRLGQVFLNLLLNAAQAIPEGRFEEHEIRVRACSSADRQRVLIEIEDTGAGIPANIMRRIFDPFFTTKAPGVGVGLGLAISHQIVRAMDGEISVESTPGRGSTFAVTLPAAATRASEASPPELPALRPSGRILLVDDEIAVGRSLAMLLAPENEVIAVTRAQEALERIDSGELFDAILCDLMMPDINGIELYERVSADARRRMIFMTGGAFTPKARQFLAKLDRPYLEKPFSENDLRKAIERVVR